VDSFLFLIPQSHQLRILRTSLRSGIEIRPFLFLLEFKTMKRHWIAGISVVTLVVGTFYLNGDRDAAAQSGARSYSGGGAQQLLPFEQKFWNYLQGTQPAYRNWAPVPGTTGEAYPGKSPHGAFLKLYLNRVAAGNPKEMPYGSIIVKENFGKDRKTLMAVTVMYRAKGYDSDHNDWYYAKYNPDGSTATKGNMKLVGKVKGCIECHAGADGNDFTFAND
jgi:hypothetical protein